MNDARRASTPATRGGGWRARPLSRDQLQDLRKLSLMGMDIGAKVVEMHGAVVRFPLPAPDMLPKATHGKHVANQREGQAVETPAQNAKQRRSAKRLLALKERWKRYANCKLHTVLHWILKRLRFRQALDAMHAMFARRTVILVKLRGLFWRAWTQPQFGAGFPVLGTASHRDVYVMLRTRAHCDHFLQQATPWSSHSRRESALAKRTLGGWLRQRKRPWTPSDERSRLASVSGEAPPAGPDDPVWPQLAALEHRQTSQAAARQHVSQKKTRGAHHYNVAPM